jgi:tripartite-type tricarboxylate transporter receptor subunit TctC
LAPTDGGTSKGTPDEVVNAIKEELKKIQKSKRADVQRKLRVIREAFEENKEPELARQ